MLRYDRRTTPGLVALPCTTSGQEMERVYSYNHRSQALCRFRSRHLEQPTNRYLRLSSLSTATFAHLKAHLFPSTE